LPAAGVKTPTLSNIIIGLEVATGKPVLIDIHELIKGRLLVQATSGGGKSYIIRKLLEETHGEVQQIILDMEGDFVTLREKFEYLLAGKGGQIPADTRSATLLARKVLELNANIIIDLSELTQQDRKKFVRLFLESLIETPKDLWNRETLVVIDEAHVFCPEKGHGESEATEAINELMSRGRKRGLCGVLATQRPAKLNKDAASQCQNKLVGLASMDVDRKRSASELGFTNREQEMSLTKIKHQFYAVGPAISNEVILIKAGPVKTRHLEPGKVGHFQAVETEKAQTILAKLADLPQQAEAELRTIADYQRKNSELQSEVYRLRNAVQQAKPAIDPTIVRQAERAGFDRGLAEANRIKESYLLRERKLLAVLENISSQVMAVLNNTYLKPEPVIPPDLTRHSPPAKAIPISLPTATKSAEITSPAIEETKLNSGQKKILQFLALQPDRFFTKSQIGAMTGFAPESGTFGTYLSGLKTADFIEQNGQTYRLKTLPADVEPIQFNTPIQALTSWLNKMGNGGQKRIYETILREPGKEWTKEELAAATDFTAESGTFGTYLSNLATLTLIEKRDGKIRLNPELLTL